MYMTVSCQMTYDCNEHELPYHFKKDKTFAKLLSKSSNAITNLDICLQFQFYKSAEI